MELESEYPALESKYFCATNHWNRIQQEYLGANI